MGTEVYDQILWNRHIRLTTHTRHPSTVVPQTFRIENVDIKEFTVVNRDRSDVTSLFHNLS